MILRCCAALGILVIVAISQFILMRTNSRALRAEAELINLAGRQRMLVQRAGLLGDQFLTTDDLEVRSHLQREIRELVTELRAAHHTVLYGDPDRGIVAGSFRVREIYRSPPANLDERLTEFAHSIDQLADSPRDQSDNEHSLARAVRDPAVHDELLGAIERLVNLLESESQEKLERLQRTGTFILVFTMLTLAATGVGVIWPMIRAVQSGMGRLEFANAALDRRASELDTALTQVRRHRDEQRDRFRALVSVMEDVEEERSKLEREIQARQIVQEALQESEKRVWSIIESSPTAMIMIGPKGRIVLVNAETEKQFGYRRQELLQQPVEILVPERFRKRHPDYRKGFFAQPESRRMGAGRDLYGLRKDGSEFPVEIGLNPIPSEDGMYVLSAIVDITERKRAEREIQRINLELQRKNVELQQFVYTISHDLKSPLVTCKGFIGILRDHMSTGTLEEADDCINRIERATERMAALIEDLLQLSRIGTIRNEPEMINTQELVQTIATDLRSYLAAVSAEVVIENELPPVLADRLRLGEVFENLLNNAIKYGCTDESPCIQVGGNQDNNEVCFYVRDNGPGIDPQFHERIFGLFQRLHSDRGGTGVGLAAVARIMQIHGGRTWVESDVGKGATFWFAFPQTATADDGHIDEVVLS